MLETLITAASIVISAWLIAWRIGREYRNGLGLQRERAREQLRLEIFKEFQTSMRAASDAVLSADTAARTIALDFIVQRSLIELGAIPEPSKKRALDFADYNSAACKAVSSLIHVIETYEIVNPELKIFQKAFGSGLHDAREAFQPFFNELLKFLPVDVPEHKVQELGTRTITRPAPNKSQLQQLESLAERYANALLEISCYIYDLRVEAQNILLGKLFEQRVRSRQPLDPKHVAITTEPEKVRDLERYFDEKTEWGKTKKRTEQAVMTDTTKTKSS